MQSDPRVNTPISTTELERRRAATRSAMAEAGIDVLLMQANDDFMGGYVKGFTDLPATQGHAEIVTFPRDDYASLRGGGGQGDYYCEIGRTAELGLATDAVHRQRLHGYPEIITELEH